MNPAPLPKAKAGWPSAEQTLLLKACLLRGADAISFWQQWRERVDFDSLDQPSFRMVPLLYKNLQRAGVSDPVLDRYKGVYRLTWSRNQLLFHAALKSVRSLEQAGIPTLLLKGATLVALYYQDAGLRPMNDFDCLVPMAQAERAVALLEQQGWRNSDPSPITQQISFAHAGHFSNGRGQNFDLHWHLLAERRQAGTDDYLWQHLGAAELAGHPVACLNTTDLLWHICAHGAVGDVIPSIRWVADACTLLQSPEARVDWEHLLRVTEQRHLSLTIERALLYLREEFGAAIPPEVTNELAQMRKSWLEHLEYRIKTSPRGWTGALPLHCTNYLRQTNGANLWHRLQQAPHYFQKIWGLPKRRKIPGYIAGKAWQRWRT